MLTTAGNLVLQGRADGILAAYRATDGKQLWEFDTGTGIMAPPVTYLVNGVQHISVMAGWGGPTGMLNLPIWSGCFWERGQIAAADAVPDVMFLRTAAASLRIDSASGEVKIEIQGATITLTASEVKIEAPQITCTASGATTQLTAAGFDALQGALKVM